MAGKRILTARVAVNMIAADDVYTAEDQLLFTEGTVLTEEVITALKEHSIFAIRIKVDDGDGKTPVMAEDAEEEIEEPANSDVSFVSSEPSLQRKSESDEKNYYEAVRESAEFKVFHESFLNTVDYMKDTFNRVVMQNEEINSEAILA